MCKLGYPLTVKPCVLFTVDPLSWGVGCGENVQHVLEVSERQWINGLHDYHKVEKSHGLDLSSPGISPERSGSPQVNTQTQMVLIGQLVIYVFSVWFWELNVEAINYIKQEAVTKYLKIKK